MPAAGALGSIGNGKNFLYQITPFPVGGVERTNETSREQVLLYLVYIGMYCSVGSLTTNIYVGRL